MKGTRVGRAPARQCTARRGEEGGVAKWRLPDRAIKLDWRSPVESHDWAPLRARHRHPIRWWRHHLAQDYDERTVRRMRRHLARLDLPAHHRWCDAATGDTTAAIGIAFGLRETDSSRLDFDVATTTLAAFAAGGSDAARAVIATMLRSLPDAGAAERRVADSWSQTTWLEVNHG
jgi:hypothetical protein